MKLLLALTAGALGYFYYCGRNARMRGAVREDLSRWEGEGGNVPSVATPSPAPARVPLADPEMRH